MHSQSLPSHQIRKGPELPIHKGPFLSLIQDNFRKHSNLIAVEDHSIGIRQSYTYGELDAQANCLSKYLLRQKEIVPDGEYKFICLILPASYNYLLAHIAVVKSSWIVVPLDPDTPDQKLSAVLDKLNHPSIITNRIIKPTLGKVLSGKSKTFLLEDIFLSMDKSTIDENGCFNLNSEVKYSHCFSTSGTTGPPKLCLGNEYGLLNIFLYFKARCNMVSKDRTLFFSSPGFDMALLQTWTAFSAGGTVVIPPPKVRRDMPSLQAFIRNENLTVLFLPTVIGECLIGENLGNVRFLQCGGESVRRVEGLRLKPGLPYVVENVYGLTEVCLVQTFHKFEGNEIMASNVGFPAPNITVCVDNQGEVWAGGDVLFTYYQEPNSEEWYSIINGTRMLRTGDIGRWGEKGLEILGRTDDQIKIAGKRVSTRGVEKQILQFPGIVTVSVEFLLGGIHAFVVPENHVQDKNTLKRNLYLNLREKLDPTEVPADILFLEKLPITTNAKVDKAGLLGILKRYQNTPSFSALSDLEKELASVWRSILNLPEERVICSDTTFYQLGGDSLTAVEFLNRVRKSRFNSIIPFHTFLMDTSLARVAALIMKHKVEEVPFNPKKDVEDLLSCIVVDELKDISNTQQPSVILLTGSTGYFAPHLLNSLSLWISQPCKIVCLIRADSESHASSRLESTLKKHQLSALSEIRKQNPLVEILPLHGDCTEPDFAPMPPNRFQELLIGCDTVIHSGADTHMFRDYDSVKPANVIAVTNIIQFCLQGRKKHLHHLSSIAVKEDVNDSGLAEAPLSWNGPALQHGYSRSKWVGDKLVSEAGNRFSLDFTLYRTGDIGMSTLKGTVNLGDIYCIFIRAFAELGCYPENFDWPTDIPVDQLAEGMACLVLDTKLRGASNFFHFGKFLKDARVQAMTSVGIHPLSFHEWYERVESAIMSKQKLSSDILLTWEWFSARKKDFHGNADCCVRVLCQRLDTTNTDIALSPTKFRNHIDIQYCKEVTRKLVS